MLLCGKVPRGMTVDCRCCWAWNLFLIKTLTSRNCQKFIEHAGFKQVTPAAEFCSAGPTGQPVCAVHRSSGGKLRLRHHRQDGQSRGGSCCQLLAGHCSCSPSPAGRNKTLQAGRDAGQQSWPLEVMVHKLWKMFSPWFALWCCGFGTKADWLGTKRLILGLDWVPLAQSQQVKLVKRFVTPQGHGFTFV